MSNFDRLMPPSASPSEVAIEAVMAERTKGIEAPISKLWDVDACPVDLLPFMAWSFSVEEWEFDWPEKTKRDVIRVAIELHRIKGTRRAVELALEVMGYRLELSEWFEHGGDPHTFRVDAFHADLSLAGLRASAPLIADLRRKIGAVKPVRSHFEVRLGVTIPAKAGLYSGVRASRLSEASHALGRPSMRAQTAASIVSNFRPRFKSGASHRLRMPVISASASSVARVHSSARLKVLSQAKHTLIERSV